MDFAKNNYGIFFKIKSKIENRKCAIFGIFGQSLHSKLLIKMGACKAANNRASCEKFHKGHIFSEMLTARCALNEEHF